MGGFYLEDLWYESNEGNGWSNHIWACGEWGSSKKGGHITCLPFWESLALWIHVGGGLERENMVDQLERGEIKNAHFLCRPPSLHHQPCWHCLTSTPCIWCMWAMLYHLTSHFWLLLPCFVTFLLTFSSYSFTLQYNTDNSCVHCTCTHPCEEWPCHLW